MISRNFLIGISLCVEKTGKVHTLKRDHDFNGKSNIFPVKSTFLLKKLLISRNFFERDRIKGFLSFRFYVKSIPKDVGVLNIVIFAIKYS